MFNTGMILPKSARDTIGVQVMTLKAKAEVDNAYIEILVFIKSQLYGDKVSQFGRLCILESVGSRLVDLTLVRKEQQLRFV